MKKFVIMSSMAPHISEQTTIIPEVSSEVVMSNRKLDPKLLMACLSFALSLHLTTLWFWLTSKALLRRSLVLQRENVKVGYKPIKTLNHSFPRPKDNNEKKDTRDVVYKVNCLSCDFVYYGQTGRAIKTRISEHKRAVRIGLLT